MLPVVIFEELDNSPGRAKTNMKTMGSGSQRGEKNSVERTARGVDCFPLKLIF